MEKKILLDTGGWAEKQAPSNPIIYVFVVQPLTSLASGKFVIDTGSICNVVNSVQCKVREGTIKQQEYLIQSGMEYNKPVLAVLKARVGQLKEREQGVCHSWQVNSWKSNHPTFWSHSFHPSLGPGFGFLNPFPLLYILL